MTNDEPPDVLFAALTCAFDLNPSPLSQSSDSDPSGLMLLIPCDIGIPCDVGTC